MPAADGVGTVSMTYLDQGHIGTLTDAAGVVWKYYYDADGKRRIKVKTAGGAATEPDGQGGVRLVADHSFYFYEGEDLICQQDMGALVARIPGTDDIDESVYEPKFLLLDHLGSTRAELVFTESGGTFSPIIQEYYDLMPYGEVIDPPTTQESVLFTGKQRDIECGLDYFGVRFYANKSCRWISPDEPFADNHITTPQSWNLFSYVRDNPINLFDNDGYKVLPPVVKVTRFDISGKSAQEAAVNAEKGNPHMPGHSGSYSAKYNFQLKGEHSKFPTTDGYFVNFESTSADTQVEIEISLPNWTEYDCASENERAAWNSILKMIQGHEDEHKQVGLDGAKEIDEALNKGTFSGQASNVDSKKAEQSAVIKAVALAQKVVIKVINEKIDPKQNEVDKQFERQRSQTGGPQ